MNQKIIMAISALMAVLFVSAFAGSILYYTDIVNTKNSEIASLNAQITKQNETITGLSDQLSKLKSQVSNLTILTSANLVAGLGITEVSSNPVNHLFIQGSVTDTGQGIAYNAGLHVVAYGTDGGLIVNVTVPAAYATFELGNFSGISNSSLLSLGTIYSGQSATVFLAIYHEGTVSKSAVTPVWTNSP